MMRKLLLGALFTTFTTGALATDMGPLAPFMTPGTVNGWTLADDGTHVTLENTSTPGSIEYIFVGEDSEDPADRTVTVTVSVLEGGPVAVAGLLYGLINEPRSYFLYGVAADGSLVFSQFDRDQGYRIIQQTQMDGVGKSNVTLMLREAGQSVELWANEQFVGKHGNERIGRGNVGIVATDIGKFAYSGFSRN